MNEITGIYLSSYHRGLNKAVHKEALGGKLFGGIGGLLGTILLGKGSWQEYIEPKMDPYMRGGAIGGAAINGALGLLKDSDVEQIDPNQWAMMTPEQREEAKKMYDGRRRSEMIRRGTMGAITGGVGGGVLGALGATVHGVAENVDKNGLPEAILGGFKDHQTQ